MLEDKQCTLLKHCSPEKNHQGTQRPVPQSPLLMPAFNALVGSERQGFIVAYCHTERLLLLHKRFKRAPDVTLTERISGYLRENHL